MIIDSIINQTPKRTGVIGIFILALFVVTAPIAAYLICKRLSSVDYTRVGRPVLNGKSSILTSMFLSILIFIYCGLLYMEWSTMGYTWFLIILTICMFITAVCMFSYGVSYSDKIIKKSDIIILSARKTGIISIKKNIEKDEVIIYALDINKYIQAFKTYGVIEFSSEEDGIYKVKKFHPLIEEYFAKAEMPEPPEIPSDLSIKWTCRGCGAVNTSSVCQYCGRAKK